MAHMPAADPRPSRAGRLLNLVRALIDYGRQLATTFRSNLHPFGTSDIALILARITRGLLLAEALEARIIRDAARLHAEPAPPRAPSHRQPPPARPAITRPTDTDSQLVVLPTPAQIAAEVRRRPIGAVIADICRDLGITGSHPLWRELQLLIIRHGGSYAGLVKDLLRQAFPCSVQAAAPAAFSPPPPSPACTGPP